MLICLVCFSGLFLFVQLAGAQEKITGPWLWMTVPTNPQCGADATDIDWLDKASGGKVTEKMIAENGAEMGDWVGDLQWSRGRIPDTGSDNINAVVTVLGLGEGDVNNHAAYALITLEAAGAQNDVSLRAGSDDSIKIWLNGEVVHKNAVNRGASDYQDKVEVDLKAGENLLLVKVCECGGGWSMFIGINADFTASGKRYGAGQEPKDPAGKITGPWLWMIAPSPQCGADGTGRDWLAEASKGKVTEEDIASRGAEEGDEVGDLKWAEGEIAPTGGDNINGTVTRIGLGAGDINNHFSYAYINVDCPKARSTWMHVGSDDSIKVWLNGEVVWTNAVNRGASDYQENFPVELRKGDNPLLVKVGECGGGWSMFVGFSEEDSDLDFNLKSPGPGQVVEPTDKLTATWGKIKDSR